MREQLPLAGSLLPPGFIARWKELERTHGEDIALSDVDVTAWHVVVRHDGREKVGNRKNGDAQCADEVWAAIHGRIE